jgi:hypothetical protein
MNYIDTRNTLKWLHGSAEGKKETYTKKIFLTATGLGGMLLRIMSALTFSPNANINTCILRMTGRWVMEKPRQTRPV